MAYTTEDSKLQAIERSLEEVKRILERLIESDQKTEKTILLDVEQCAQLTGLSVSTIYKHCHHKNLPHFKAGKFLRFKKNEIEDWVTSNRIKTVDEIKAEANNYLTTQS